MRVTGRLADREPALQPESSARSSHSQRQAHGLRVVPVDFRNLHFDNREAPDALSTSEPSRSVTTTGPTECLTLSPVIAISAKGLPWQSKLGRRVGKGATVDRPVGTPIVAADRMRVCLSSLGGARRTPGPTRLVKPWPQVRPAPYGEPAPRAGASRPGRTPGGLPGRQRPGMPPRTRDLPSRPR